MRKSESSKSSPPVSRGDVRTATPAPVADTRGLDALLDLRDPQPQWSDADLAAMLMHQLSLPLDGTDLQIRSILLDRGTSPDLLLHLKRVAKINRSVAGSTMPSELWRVIYFAAIAAGLVGAICRRPTCGKDGNGRAPERGSSRPCAT
jgi:hypothetical protein